MSKPRRRKRARRSAMPQVAPRWSGARALAQVQTLNGRCLECSDFDLAADIRKLIAQCPMMLVSLNFGDEQWWLSVCASRPMARREDESMSSFGIHAGKLAHQVLALAWRIAGMDRGTAVQLFGMAPGVAALIEAFEPDDLERIAARYGEHLHWRWRDHPTFGGYLLAAARAGDRESLHSLRFHCLRL